MESPGYVLQPVTRSASSAGAPTPAPAATYLGTDCGSQGTGMWHSLSGLMEEKDDCLDLGSLLPAGAGRVPAQLRRSDHDEPRGAGSVRLELKSADGQGPVVGVRASLRWATTWQELVFAWDPTCCAGSSHCTWAGEPGRARRAGLAPAEHTHARRVLRRGALSASRTPSWPGCTRSESGHRERARARAGRRGGTPWPPRACSVWPPVSPAGWAW